MTTKDGDERRGHARGQKAVEFPPLYLYRKAGLLPEDALRPVPGVDAAIDYLYAR